MPGEGLASGLSVGDGVAVASGDGVGVTLGDGLGDPFFLPPFFVEGDGELFGVGVTEASGAGVGEALACGELVGFGVALALGVALGDESGFGEGVGVELVFFFVELLELLRFFGGGVGSKIPLILSPNDCASAAGDPNKHASAVSAHKLRTPTRVILSQRRRRRTSRGVLGLRAAKNEPFTLREVLRRASPASG